MISFVGGGGKKLEVTNIIENYPSLILRFLIRYRNTDINMSRLVRYFKTPHSTVQVQLI